MLTPWPRLQFQSGIDHFSSILTVALIVLWNAKHRVHPFRHPQFLRLVGIEPNELPDDSEMEADLEGPSQRASYVSGNSSDEHLSFLKRIKEKMKADKEVRAAEHARFIWRRFRTKQFIYIEARRAIITLKKSCGELDEGQVKLIPPHECDYGGPWYEGDDDQSFSSKFVGALIRACGLLFSAPSTNSFLT